ncbi:hypothetical protein AAFF_G00225100 [Aldrovandia affinis]|uniref:Uncharacterized protein n=1 Tax=Aldrovandia affinis TaxID=143900 RepID=A0AAD7TBN9_9TELE|nr:hypothetical protein AAFF_G00225100 [Aldrovandia affinis]
MNSLLTRVSPLTSGGAGPAGGVARDSRINDTLCPGSQRSSTCHHVISKISGKAHEGSGCGCQFGPCDPPLAFRPTTGPAIPMFFIYYPFHRALGPLERCPPSMPDLTARGYTTQE